MKPRKNALSLAPRARLTSAVGSLLVGSGIVVAVSAAFFQAAADPWLLPTPQVLEIAAACRAKPQRRDQDECLRTLVASRSGERAGERLARDDDRPSDRPDGRLGAF
ncbi:MAG: hypothetical protein LCI02_13960 [Proteobacteria bacterium]|nr:hypothetical protein [Pseudomonadota bacterium]